MAIYLDTASTQKPTNGILEAIKPYIETNYYNPSSLYCSAVKIKEDIEAIRGKIAKLINAHPNEIIFNSGSTEGNNHVIRGFDDANYRRESIIISTPLEHSSILNALKNPALRSTVLFCDVNEKGFVDLQHLEFLLKSCKNKKVLVSIIYAQNEIGTLQNLKEISNLVHSYKAVLHTDCTQALPYIQIDVKELGIDLMTASAHKLGGLKGAGFLYKSKNVELSPLIYGEQENKNRGGTENTVGIVALGEAVKVIDYNKSIELCEKQLYFMRRLIVDFDCTINGSVNNRLPNNINVTFPQNITGESLLYTLDLGGIQISVGSACNSHSIKPSYVLKAIGLTDDEAMRTIRITISDDITYQDIDKVIEEIGKSIKLIET